MLCKSNVNFLKYYVRILTTFFFISWILLPATDYNGHRRVPLSCSIKRRNRRIVHNATYKIKIGHSLIMYIIINIPLIFSLSRFTWSCVPVFCDNFLRIYAYTVLRISRSKLSDARWTFSRGRGRRRRSLRLLVVTIWNLLARRLSWERSSSIKLEDHRYDRDRKSRDTLYILRVRGVKSSGILLQKPHLKSEINLRKS